MWEYMCGMTCAQIELMSIDKPLTLYGNKSKGPTAEELLEAQKEWEEKYGGKKDLKVELHSRVPMLNLLKLS